MSLLSLCASMVVDDFNFVGISVSPFKAHPVAPVDPNAVLARAIASEFLKVVARGNPQIFDRGRIAHQLQFAQGYPAQISRHALSPSTPPELLRAAIPETDDHH